MTYPVFPLRPAYFFFGFVLANFYIRDCSPKQTPFGAFAVGPVEALATFWPLALLVFPMTKFFIPMYFSAIVAFVFLNFYLHSGIRIELLETLLPKVGLNVSSHHNVHHESFGKYHYGEVSFVWDYILGTRDAASGDTKSHPKRQ